MNKRRSSNLVNAYNFNPLHLHEHNANLNAKNYFSSKSPLLPMSFRDLRLVVANRIPTNLILLPDTLSLSQTSIHNPKKEHKKRPLKQPSIDVYRSLARSSSHCTTNSERDMAIDELTLLKNSFTVDRISPLSHTGFFRTQNLPKIQKNKSVKLNNKISSNYEDRRSTTPETLHRTTPTKEYYGEENKNMTTATKLMSCLSNNQSRKQLHIYMPSINC